MMRSSQGNKRNASIEEEEEKTGREQGCETPESESKERRIHNKPTKQRTNNEDEKETPEAKEEEGLIFLPISLELENLRDWAVPGSEGDKGALVEVNNRKVLLNLNPLI